MNTMRKAWPIPVLAAAAVCWGSTLAAQDKDEQEGNQAAVAKAVLALGCPSSVVWRRARVKASRFPPSSKSRTVNCSSPSTP